MDDKFLLHDPCFTLRAFTEQICDDIQKLRNCFPCVNGNIQRTESNELLIPYIIVIIISVTAPTAGQRPLPCFANQSGPVLAAELCNLICSPNFLSPPRTFAFS